MAGTQTGDDLEKALAFFERAEEVAASDNFDYAIEMYLEGLRRAPDALEQGHLPLRQLALKRQARGGKKPTVVEKMKHMGGKTPVEELVNASYLFAKDPDNTHYAETLLKAAVKGNYRRTAEWIAQLVFEANRASEKPSFATYMLLKDCYIKLQQFGMAVSACRHGVQMKPNDEALQLELRNLSAQMTMQKGKYNGKGDFTGSIKDRERQQELIEAERPRHSEDKKKEVVNQARAAYKENPDSVDNIVSLADAMFGLGTAQGHNDAILFLKRAYEKKGEFAIKKRWHELKMRRLRILIQLAKTKAKQEPENAKRRQDVMALAEQYNKEELRYWEACVEHYPTDLRMKYDYGICLIKNGLYDEAIPVLQEAQREPGKRVAAMDETGLCFFLKGWYQDAIDIFQEAFRLCEVRDSDLAKDIRYNLARSYEEDGQSEKALEYYRKLAQLDFKYKDVSQRVENLRKSGK
ncbi:putative methyltransferase (contains TPR repeat) [Anaerohalosphaera lusitana]|uniref:Putative methyltransferase (Contains TPR repeat) n=1 Tax=Anaerohalosphaera lusitana TaxID=1936003 RepID=A0A1U9NIG9_9BACT|nr:tetratricopeptide repeat protein [Anaerohalosphaera lusitana]AQT67380.1 putative methyltransferase (contains TPR repeat) [Anaerohalosphaera lusitana]